MNPATKLASIILAMSLTEFFLTLEPEKNAWFWFAGTVGAFVIRLAPGRIHWKRSVAGWLMGSICAFFLAPAVCERWALVTFANQMAGWFIVGFIGDVLMLIISWVRNKAAIDPGQTFDVSLSTTRKVYDVFGPGSPQTWAELGKKAIDLFRKPPTIP